MYTYVNNNDYLAHYGVPGMKWGVRKVVETFNRFRGSTNAGLNASSGIPKATVASASQIRKSANQTQALTGSKPRKKVSKKNREKAKKIAIAAGAVTIAAVTAYGLHRYHKTTQNLSQLAKQKIEDDFKAKSQFLSDKDLKKEMGKQTRRMLNAESRHGARKELGLKNRKAFKAYMHNNGVKKLKAIDIAAQRHKDALDSIKGYKRSAITKKMRPYTQREINKAKKRYLKRVLNTMGA